MLNEFFQDTNLIAIIALVIVIVLFVIYKLSSKKASEELIEDDFDIENTTSQSMESIEDEYDDIQNDEELYVENSDEVIAQEIGAEEGDFGVIQEPIKDETAQTKKLHKREVPPHGKISKESFKEFDGKRILLAEDNLINQKVILGLLADSGIDVVIANDGQEALSILGRDSNFNVILMDAHMPNIDGFEATRRIRANSELDHIVVVALSGDIAIDDIRKMTEAGMSEHLEKPLKMDALYDVLYAYTADQHENAKSINPEDAISVISTKELDGEKGLDICGGDEVFYRDILQEFLDTYSDSDEKLFTMLHSHELKQADKLLLDIVGVSANIGALQLQKIATQMKDSLDDEQERSYLTLIQQYQHHLQLLLHDIKEYLK